MMELLILVTEILGITLFVFLGIIIVISVKNTKFEEKKEKYRVIYQNMIVDYAMGEMYGDKSKISLDKELIFPKKSNFDYRSLIKRMFLVELFIEQAIIVINSFQGRIRNIIIEKMNEIGVSEYLFRKFKRAKDKKEREYYLFRIGELRNKKFINKLMQIEENKIFKKGYYKGYFIALSTLVDAWIHDMTDEEINAYIKKVFTVLVYLNAENEVDLKKFFEIFLMGKSNFFNALVRNKKMRKDLCEVIFKSNLSLVHRGMLLNMIALNHQLEVGEICLAEANEYLAKDQLSEEEKEYLNYLIKSLGEIGLAEYYSIIKTASESDNWVTQTIAAKYLHKFDFHETYEILYNMLFHNNWWIRYNSALSLEKLGLSGYQYLLRTFSMDDKYAKEVAAHALVNGSFYNYILKFLINENTDFALNEISKIINGGNNLTIVDKLLGEKRVSLKVKFKLIESIDNSEFVFYFDEVLKNKVMENEVFDLALEKREYLFQKEVENELG